MERGQEKANQTQPDPAFLNVTSRKSFDRESIM